MIEVLYVVSSDYDIDGNCIVLKLYNTETERIEYYFDKYFSPYFLSHKKMQMSGIKTQVIVRKYDALNDNYKDVWKISTTDPNIIASMNRRMRYDEKKGIEKPLIWENHIKFFQTYIYDKDIKIGMPYQRNGDGLLFLKNEDVEKRIHDISKLVTDDERDTSICEEFARLLEYPAPNFKRAAIDIEVLGEDKKRIPDSDNANMPIICVCMADNSSKKMAFVLIQEEKNFDFASDEIDVELFSDEKEMIKRVFSIASFYPFLLTFNGDEFDFPYLANRALRLGIPLSEIPIFIRKKMALYKNSIHIDLYKFFEIRAMQIYAFKQKYKVISLDAVSKALLGEGKINKRKWVNEMSYHELINYCMKDAELSLRLSTYDNNLVMNLMLVLARLSKTPIDVVSRKSISNWIRSMIYSEHRRRNILIPRSEDILEMKGVTATTALIKGKKYKGAIVVKPVAGIHFNTKVGDFASLYPTIMKVYNLGYGTVNCPHPECKSNNIAELPHWICTKRRAIESQVIGLLRDLRVVWYKKKANKEENELLKHWYSVAEQSLKVFCNAAYGVFGDENFVLYCPPFAESVTGLGRWIITQTIQQAQALQLAVLYGDTDSIFLKNPEEEKMERLMSWCKSEFDIEFELDKSYRFVALSTRKKNYIGVLTDGEVDVKGLTGKKKHTPKIFKDVFSKVKLLLKEINTPDDIGIKKREIKDAVKEIYNTLYKRRWSDINDLAFHVTMNSEIEAYTKTTPQHVKAAKYLLSKGYEVGKGSTIDFVKVVGNKVKPAELTDVNEVDVQKYIEFLKNVFTQILDPLGIDWDEDILGKTILDRFCE